MGKHPSRYDTAGEGLKSWTLGMAPNRASGVLNETRSQLHPGGEGDSLSLEHSRRFVSRDRLKRKGVCC